MFERRITKLNLGLTQALPKAHRVARRRLTGASRPGVVMG